MTNKNENEESSECLYGFKRKFFIDVLYMKAKKLHPNDSEEVICENKLPELLDQLYETMDRSDMTVDLDINTLLL